MWKTDLVTAQEHHEAWWRGDGLVLWVTAPKDDPWEPLPRPAPPRDAHDRWYGLDYRIARAEHSLAHTYFGGDSMPVLGTWSGAGDLAAYLGCPVQPSMETVWFHPVIGEPPEAYPRLVIQPDNPVLRDTLALVDHAVARSSGRYFVSQPDLVENIDILASLRGAEALMMDMIERPEWVEARLWEINEAFFEAFDLFQARIRDARGGNTFVFNLWGPGRTAKVQCDACAMFGPAMFRRFVAPAMEAQCRRLDYAMFHLDGEECLPNLEALLEVESIRAVEWTPKMAYGAGGGGDPRWYDLYRRILAAGKGVQAIRVKPQEVIPLLDAVGPRGMFICTHAADEAAAARLEERVAAYR